MGQCDAKEIDGYFQCLVMNIENIYNSDNNTVQRTNCEESMLSKRNPRLPFVEKMRLNLIAIVLS